MRGLHRNFFVDFTKMLAPTKFPSRVFQDRIRRFIEAQECRRQWISLAEIAEWCGCLTGNRDGAKERRGTLTRDAYRDLISDAIAGKFPRLLFLSADAGEPKTLDGPFFQQRMEKFAGKGEDEVVISAYVAKCWVPLRDARSWFASRAVPAPLWLSGFGIVDRRKAQAYGKRPKGRPPETGLDDSAAVEFIRRLVLEGSSQTSAATIACRTLGRGGPGTEQSAITRYRKKYAAKYGRSGD
jgi:hypothetical protein